MTVAIFAALIAALAGIAVITIMRINPPDHEEEIMTTETIPGQKAPIAHIIEPIRPPYQPYITMDPAVAERRTKKGDIVTPYHSKRVVAGEDEL